MLQVWAELAENERRRLCCLGCRRRLSELYGVWIYGWCERMVADGGVEEDVEGSTISSAYNGGAMNWAAAMFCASSVHYAPGWPWPGPRNSD